MKEYKFNLDKPFLDAVFAPIRSKQQVIYVLMRCIKLMLIGNAIPDSRKVGEMHLLVSKRSRLYLFSGNKYFSLSFPFYVDDNNLLLRFYSKNISNIDSKITSDVIQVLTAPKRFDSIGAYEFVEPLVDLEKHEPEFWPFLLGLFMYDDGYVRYDHDPENENGDLHPLHHYDFFHSSSASCKVGLRRGIEGSHLVAFLSAETSCMYIEDTN